MSKKIHKFCLLLPPMSAVEVIESMLFVCVCVCLSGFVRVLTRWCTLLRYWTTLCTIDLHCAKPTYEHDKSSWCKMQVGGAQRRSMMHNMALYH